MLTEVKTLEPRLKQILYGAVEHIQATKAALYLSASHDLNQKTYELVTHYRFTDDARRLVRGNDDVVDRIAVKRDAFFINGLGTDSRFSEMLFRQGTDRLLVTPLFSRGRLVGFLDMRDKAGKKPFDGRDIDAAKRIGEEVMAVLSVNRLYGVGPITLVEESPQRSAPSAPSAVMAQPQAVTARRAELSADAMRAIEAARQFMAVRQHNTVSGKRALSQQDLDVLALLLPTALAIPGAAVACLSAIGHMNNPHAIAALATVSDDALSLIHSHLQAWMRRANKTHIVARPPIQYPFGAQVAPFTASVISAIVSMQVNPHSIDGLVLTVAFESTAETIAYRAVQIFIGQIESSVEAAIAASTGGGDRQVIAEKLLEPDFAKFPDLAAHSKQVAVLSGRFARLLELPASQVETVRLAALVHDVGLRLLDYERMYKRPGLTAEEMRALAEHPVVGAALVEPLLGPEVAQAVLRHHERVDGKGYPSRLTGQQIPVAARILQICDAWVAMTSPQSYQISITREQAVHNLQSGAGAQFDGALVTRFLGALHELGA